MKIKNRCYRIQKDILVDGLDQCLENIKILLEHSKINLKENSDNYVALGLYSFAIEEFGKFLVLKEKLSEKDLNTYSVPKEIFGGGDAHNIKFKKVSEQLPQECVNLAYGVTTATNPSLKSSTISVTPKGENIVIPPGLTGTFLHFGNNPIDLNTRMSCLYLNWDDTKKTWKNKPKIVFEVLDRAIWKFQLIIKNIDSK